MAPGVVWLVAFYWRVNSVLSMLRYPHEWQGNGNIGGVKFRHENLVKFSSSFLVQHFRTDTFFSFFTTAQTTHFNQH
jgi:hypothetical protein